MKNALTKTVQIFASELFSTDIALYMIGVVNRVLLGGRLNTIILFYPANEKYLRNATFSWYARFRRWNPRLAGIFVLKQGGGVFCAMGSHEAEFSASENRDQLQRVHQRMQRMAKLVGAKTASYAGILPSILARSGVQREPIERERTVHWVLCGIEQVRKIAGLSASSPIVILGASGFVGSQVVERLQQSAAPHIIQIDPAHPDPACRSPRALEAIRGQRAIIVNISRNQVIEQYANQLWEGLVVLNEVYPECTSETLAILKRLNIRYFHIQGVKAFTLPDFPGAYRGAVPCCAASAAEATARVEYSDSFVSLMEQ